MRKRAFIELDGLSYTVFTSTEAARNLICHARFGHFFSVFTPGVTMAAQAAGNAACHAVLQQADMLLPDGTGLTLAARLAGEGRITRCPGIEVAEALLPLAAARGLRLFLYGGKEGVARLAAERIGQKYPGLTLGFRHGYGGDPAMLIRAFRPDVLFVCLGFPAQEEYILRHREDIPCLCLGLGGTLDVFSGSVTRSPAFFRRTGLEWAYRVAHQPGRIVRLFPVPFFLFSCLGGGIKKLLHNSQKRRPQGKPHRDL